VTLLATLGLCAVISFPIIFISPKTMQEHEGLAITSILLAIFVGVTVITIYANRWKKRDELKRSGQNRAIGVAITTLLVFAAGASAQTTYSDPGGSFTVSVPAGWKAQKNPENSQVTISKGDASVSFDVAPTEDGSTPPPKDVLESVKKQVIQSCPQAEVLRSGDAALAGQPGLYVQISCNDPQHGAAVTTVAVATTNGKVLIGIMTAYSTEYSGVKPIMDRIADSIQLGGDGTDARRQAFLAAMSPDRSNQDFALSGNSDAAGNAQKLKALEGACSSGVLTREECAAKRAALTKGGSSAKSSGNSAQLQALQRACDAGVFTPAECKAKLAALNGGGSNGGSNTSPNPGPNTDSNVWQSNDPAPPPAQSDRQRGGRNDPDPEQTMTGGGNLYKDAHGAFSIMIPQGWSAKPNRGCWGPSENCPRDATGVNINSPGKSWAFVAPFSGDAKRPTDVVKSVAEHIRSELQNFEVLQNDPDKLNGLNIAIGHFTGVNQDGEGVSLVVIGIAVPGGRYFVAESYIPQSELQTAGPALSSMPGTLRFAGQ
jgi:hypothetical protein